MTHDVAEMVSIDPRCCRNGNAYCHVLCFQVVVIDKGTIAEMGTHDELLQQNGVYKRLVLRQLTAGTTNTAASTTEGSSGDVAVLQTTVHLDLSNIQSEGPASISLV